MSQESKPVQLPLWANFVFDMILDYDLRDLDHPAVMEAIDRPFMYEDDPIAADIATDILGG